MFHAFYRDSVHEKMDEFKRYVEFSQNLLAENLKKNKSENIKRIREIDDDFYREKFQELFWESESEEEFVFSSIHWSSVFIAQYSYVEHILDKVCSYYAAQTESPLTHKDMTGSGIERAKSYISKYMGISAPFGKSEWGKIKSYAKIRNKVIHSGVELDQRSKIDLDVIRLINKSSNLSLARYTNEVPVDPWDEENTETQSYLEEPRVDITPQFVIEVVDTYDKFFDSLFDELEKLSLPE
ncbi:hypothetical protein [Vibrio parahaemolyticus]|uniref:hypothetical protein n=1 Tax=Vibrio parahaemolyticus TaxID=670 RepID=UPI00387B7D4E